MADKPICSIPDCGKPQYCRNFCKAHYSRLWSHGSAHGGRQPHDGKCVVDGCDAKRKARGLCYMHDKRMKVRGTLDRYKSPTRIFLEQLLLTTSDDCVIWPFARNNRGYAFGCLSEEGGEAKFLVHRYACEKVNGAPPTEYHQAAHSCGNGYLGCVNPRHTSWKTQKENEADKLVHGTFHVGEASSRAILGENEAREIKSRSDKSQHELAAIYGISRSAVADIRTGRTWKHIVISCIHEASSTSPG